MSAKWVKANDFGLPHFRSARAAVAFSIGESSSVALDDIW